MMSLGAALQQFRLCLAVLGMDPVCLRCGRASKHSLCEACAVWLKTAAQRERGAHERKAWRMWEVGNRPERAKKAKGL